MSELSQDCLRACPYRYRTDFEDLGSRCSGRRIVLGDVDDVTDEVGNVIGELARTACGSIDGPDKDLPTMSVQDYANTNLRMTDLLTLYGQGLLPEQIRKN